MNRKGLVVRIPSGCCFETSDVGSVPKLRLCIAADDLVLHGAEEVEIALLVGALVEERELNGTRVSLSRSFLYHGALDAHQEHCTMQAIWHGLSKQVDGDVVLLQAPFMLDGELT